MRGIYYQLAVSSCLILQSYCYCDIRQYISYQGHGDKSQVAGTTWVKQGKYMTPGGKEKKLPEPTKGVL